MWRPAPGKEVVLSNMILQKPAVRRRRDNRTFAALVRVNVHYPPSITHSLLIHLLTLRHTLAHTPGTYMQADTPSNKST